MKILLLSHWYDPEPTPYPHTVAKEMVNRGHSVLSIVGFPNYPTGKIFEGYKQTWRKWEEKDGVKILRIPIYPNHSSSSIKRSLNYLSYSLSASLMGSMLCKQADIIWVYSPVTAGIPAVCIGALKHIPYIYTIQDLWPETFYASNFSTSKLISGPINRLSNVIHHYASTISVISPGFKQDLIQKGVPANKIHIITNWADETIYRPVDPDIKIAEEYGLTGYFIVMYGGNIGACQGLDNAIKAAEILKNIKQIKLVFIGNGLELPDLKDKVKNNGIGNVIFIERQPEHKMPYFYAWADVLLVHLRKNPLFEITIPSKMLAYLACGKPILSTVLGDTADILNKSGSGIVCPPDDPEALAQTILKIYSENREKLHDMGQSSRQTYLENFTKNMAMNKYESLFHQTAGLKSNP